MSKSQKNNARGLCRICYGRASRLIAAGETSWTELEKLGLATPPVDRDKFRRLIAQRRQTYKKGAA